MAEESSARRAWISGFATGIAVCGLAMYAKRKVPRNRPRVFQDEATVIPID